MTSAAGEMLLSGSLFFLVLSRRPGGISFRGHPPRYFLLCGIAWCLNFISFWLAIGSVTRPEELVVVGLVNYLWPVLTFSGAVFVARAAWGWTLIPGLALAFAGAVVAKLAVSERSPLELLQTLSVDPNLVAYGLALTAAVSWAVYSNAATILADRKSTSGVPLFMVLCAGPAFLAGISRGEPWHFTLGTTLFYLGWSSLCGSAFILWDQAMQSGSATFVSGLSMLIPFASTLITAWSAGVTANVLVLLAGVMTVVGSWVSQKSVLRSAERLSE